MKTRVKKTAVKRTRKKPMINNIYKSLIIFLTIIYSRIQVEIKDADNQGRCCVEKNSAIDVLLKAATAKISVAGAIRSLMERLDGCISFESSLAQRLGAMAA